MKSPVKLAVSNDPLQRTLIEEVLREAEIPFTRVDAPLSSIFGQTSPLGFVEYRVEERYLDRAKETLCGYGIVCDVSERLLERTLSEVIRPLLKAPVSSPQSSGRDYGRLSHLVEINNKETVEAIFAATLTEEGGRALLEDFFFYQAAASSPRLINLARSLAHGATDAFLERYVSAASTEATERLALLDVLPAFPSDIQRRVLKATLLDADRETRDAANDVLYMLTGSSHGYDPDGTEPERKEAVARIERLFA